MKPYILLFTLLLGISMTSFGQKTDEPDPKKKGELNNTIFFGVEQTVLNVSFERRFIHTSKFFLVGRVGGMAEIISSAEIAPGYVVELGLVMGRRINFIESGLKYYKIMPQDPQGLNRDKGFQGAFIGYRLLVPGKYPLSLRLGVSIGEAFNMMTRNCVMSTLTTRCILELVTDSNFL